ncbi:MAG: hypothetical protein AB8U25_00635 [Rickettsiales endosymbiont of Dermacentor nuttalli]
MDKAIITEEIFELVAINNTGKIIDLKVFKLANMIENHYGKAFT